VEKWYDSKVIWIGTVPDREENKEPKIYILKTPWEAMKVYRGSRGITLLLNLGAK
jgi:hypothetical protein